jgi:hypothetical protein
VNTAGAFTHGTPEVLFEVRMPIPLNGPHYDVSSDGERFLTIGFVAPEEDPRNELVVVQNWMDVLDREAGSD